MDSCVGFPLEMEGAKPFKSVKTVLAARDQPDCTVQERIALTLSKPVVRL